MAKQPDPIHVKSRMMKRYFKSARLQYPAGVMPVHFEPSGSYKYRSTPQKSWTEAPDHLKNQVSRRGPGACIAKNVAGKGKTTLNQEALLNVRELAYPGRSTRPLDAQFAYVIDIAQKALIAEIQAVSATSWLTCQGSNLPDDPGTRALAVARETTVIVPAVEIGVYVSPHRLSEDALLYLKNNLDECVVKTCIAPRTSTMLAAPDAFRWAEDCHTKFFSRRVKKYLSMIHHLELRAATAIAGTLDKWITMKDDDGDADPLDIEDEIDKSDMDKFQNEMKSSEETLRKWADEAGCYLAEWIDSPVHRTAEIAGQELPPAIVRTYCHYKFIGEGLSYTEPTRQLMAGLVADSDRFLRTHVFIFGDSKSPWDLKGAPAQPTGTKGTAAATTSKQSAFTWGKRSWGRSMNVFKEYLPAYTRYRMKTSGLAIEIDSSTGQISKGTDVFKVVKEKYWSKLADFAAEPMSNLGVGEQKRLQKILKEAQTEGGDVAKYISRRGKAYRIAWTKALRETNVQEDFKAAKYFEKLDEQLKWFKAPAVKATITGIDGILGTVNLVFKATAWSDEVDRFGSVSTSTAISLVQATAELSKWALGLLKDVDTKILGSLSVGSAAAGAAGAAAIVGGICQTISSYKAMDKSLDQRHYGQAVGHGLAMAGGILVTIGGIIVLGTVISAEFGAAVGSIFGPLGTVGGGTIGAIVGVIGSLLVAIGALIAWMFSSNQFEEFAANCCFGDPPSVFSDKPVTVDWCDQVMYRLGKPSTHLRNLQVLASNFRVTIKGNGDPRSLVSELVIDCGFLPDGHRFDIELKQTYKFGNGAENTYRCWYLLDPTTGLYDWTNGLYPHLKFLPTDGPKIVTQQGAKAKGSHQISIHLHPQMFFTAGKNHSMELTNFGVMYTEKSEVYIKLVRGGNGFPPIPYKKGKSIYMYFDTKDKSGDTLSSLDSSLFAIWPGP